ncbi:TetR family transcriptional regulator [Clavibacter michiganensis]|uniref:TetR family transcriptional regulator n=1 Tax=Clavibacter michiganensis TaxID=28447 RepID=A0A2S5VXG6_9MICO|nr:TetR family transcriptional regulator [Clavibacter michiganensis]PPF70488.1 TetR family transcriptional regulator [Clavibacter michiganensis]
MATSASPERAAGRPVAIDAAELARVAIALFAERGYDAVSMADVAEAAGVGRRSLFRYFPSKADLVWGGAEAVVEVLDRLLAAGTGGRPLGAAYADAFVRALEASGIDLGMTRVRLRIIDAHPELRGLASPRLGAGSHVLAGFVASGRPELRGTVEAAVLADALGASTYAALRWWATSSDDPRPDAAIRRGVDALALAGGSDGTRADR